MTGIKKDNDIFEKVSVLIEKAREKIAYTINEQMIILYWDIGKIIKKNIMKKN